MRTPRTNVRCIIILVNKIHVFFQGELNMTRNIMRNMREEASLILTDSGNIEGEATGVDTGFQHEDSCVCVSVRVCLTV